MSKEDSGAFNYAGAVLYSLGMSTDPATVASEGRRILNARLFPPGQLTLDHVAAAKEGEQQLTKALVRLEAGMEEWRKLRDEVSANRQLLEKQLNDTLHAIWRQHALEEDPRKDLHEEEEEEEGEEEEESKSADGKRSPSRGGDEQVASLRSPTKRSKTKEGDEEEESMPRQIWATEDPWGEAGEVVDLSGPPPQQSPPSSPRSKKSRAKADAPMETETDPVKLLKIFTRKSVPNDDLKDCFKCKNDAGCGYHARVNKVNDRPNNKTSYCGDPQTLWEAYDDIARVLDNTGCITRELRPFLLCGNCSVKAGVNVKTTVLADDYVEFCELFNYKVKEATIAKLRAAAEIENGVRKRRRRTVSQTNVEVEPLVNVSPPKAMEKPKTSRGGAKKKLEAMEIDTGYDEEDDEEEEESVEDDDVLNLLAMVRKNLKTRPTNLRTIEHPMGLTAEAQILFSDEEKKMCVCCDLVDDVDDADLWMVFYHEKYTGLENSGPESEPSRWVGLTEDMLVDSGCDIDKAKVAIATVRRFAAVCLANNKH